MPTRSQRVPRLQRLICRALRYHRVRNRRRLYDLLERHPEVQSGFLSGCSFLIRIVWRGDCELVRWLMDHGVSPDLCCRGDNTPLMHCAGFDELELGRILLDAGAEVDRANASNETALGFACAYNSVEMVRLLCERGADVNYLEGNPPCHYLFDVRCAKRREDEREAKTAIEGILVSYGAVLDFEPPPLEEDSSLCGVTSKSAGARRKEHE